MTKEEVSRKFENLLFVCGATSLIVIVILMFCMIADYRARLSTAKDDKDANSVTYHAYQQSYAVDVVDVAERYLNGGIDSSTAADMVRTILSDHNIIDRNNKLTITDIDTIDPIYRVGQVDSPDKELARACWEVLIELEWRSSGRGTVSSVQYVVDELKEVME